ncbi:MAG: VOC family protein [Mesorhizobium sp.]
MNNAPDRTGSPTLATSGILRPFVPSKDLELSQQFYSAVGFQVSRKSERIALVSLGDADSGVSFLLQDFYVPALAENLMLQLVVPDLSAWWKHLASLRLEERFEVRPPKPPARAAWGADVVYFWDPAGVLWHVVSLEGIPS